jgi:hypothetical protein
MSKILNVQERVEEIKIQLSNRDTTENRPNKKILLIDDILDDLESEIIWFETVVVSKEELAKTQYELIFAKTFEEGMEKILIEIPDLIISEVYLASPRYLPEKDLPEGASQFGKKTKRRNNYSRVLIANNKQRYF